MFHVCHVALCHRKTVKPLKLLNVEGEIIERIVLVILKYNRYAYISLVSPYQLLVDIYLFIYSLAK